ncbi:MAG: bifunctional UDP-N-acetylglucosamine diphosphorylase/glucosamine-1-phosphate N-acetyltransferase GlmU [Ruminococcaceae bacterium]|nr:bifunctional UDP-N-acetylglucosamine diphosphorylase/glucosamine-1-phosphate N-acetyltransferase GlmU [Oscillospiraceae bacterium]
MSKRRTNCVVLAAGDGKRMFSKSSKVLCEVSYKPMILWVLDAAKNSGIDEICAVISNEDVERTVGSGIHITYQKQRLGTGHAVGCAREFLEEHSGEETLILYGDVPFIDVETISESLKLHRDNNASATVISAVIKDPTGYGRIVRKGGNISAIVEEIDADDATASIKEINSGAGWFSTDDLLQSLDKISNDNAKGEYYLTDAIGIMISEGKKVAVYKSKSSDVTLGANTPLDLLNLNDIARERILKKHLSGGVHFVSRSGISIGPDVNIMPGAKILPGSILYGKTSIGSGSVIGPNSLVFESSIGKNTSFNSSQIRNSSIGDEAEIGPFVQIRPCSTISDKVKLGNFVEIKNSDIGEGTSVAHLTYIGDSDVGRYCNFGCGVVVVNYDGEEKKRTTVKDFAFVGCNTNLISPVTVGKGAYTAAGCTVIKDIPDGALAIDRGQLNIKPGWAANKLKKYIEKKSKLLEMNNGKSEDK